MADFDVLVIGGGPAGYAAALRAAELGARVALAEAEQLGGACVNFACIPTDALLSAVEPYLNAKELSVMGVIDGAETFNFARAAARKDGLVRQVADGVAVALRMRKVTTLRGRARLLSPTTIEAVAADGAKPYTADAVVLASGTTWEAPSLPGLRPEMVLTADVIQSLVQLPKAAVVVGGGPAGTAFAVEYAFLLAVAGVDVTYAEPAARAFPMLDASVAAVARAALVDAGVAVYEGATVTGTDAGITVTHHEGAAVVEAEVVVAPDVRRPRIDGLGLEAAGVHVEDGSIPVDRAGRTNVQGVFAAGDVTGRVMLSSAASHSGEVAGENAAGGSAVTRLGSIPHLLHTVPGVGWIGVTEEQARATGRDVVSGVFDLGYNARAVTLGARQGVVKVIADRTVGEILGVQAVGPDIAELMNVAAVVMQTEGTLDDLAALRAWHPSITEGLVEAARRAAAAR